MNDNEMPNQSSGCSEHHIDFLKRAAEACEHGDFVLGMHLYLAAYEMAVADPSIADGMALSGLREAWHLACELKERSMAEYVFEKLEPYLTGEEIAACAGKLQSLALDRLEQYGFSREDLEEMAQMISADFGGADPSVVKVESIAIPNAGMFGVPDYGQDFGALVTDSGKAEEASELDEAVETEALDTPNDADEGEGATAADVKDEEAEAEPKGGRQEKSREAKSPRQIGLSVANIDDFNPYDQYRDYSIGKSYHCATNEGSGAAVFTLDEERATAHEQFLAQKEQSATAASGHEQSGAAKSEAGQGAAASEDSPKAVANPPAQVPAPAAPSVLIGVPGTSVAKQDSDVPDMPNVAPVANGPFNYRALSGYDEAVAIMRDFGVGLQNDRGFQDFIGMLNDRHGLDRAPALDTFLFRAPVLEDATRFADATVGELGLPSLRMSMEEGVQGMPVLCVIAQGNNRPRMNHAHNRFEAPAVLVLDDLDTWMIPQAPEGVEGMAGFMMANVSRGAREAINLIRSAVEDPNVIVLATSTIGGEVDPFFYEVLEPLTIIDIANPNEQERADIWAEIMRDHPSMRRVNRADLTRFSNGLSRYDIYMAARDAIEEAYKLGVVQRSYVPVTALNVFEKLAACQPLESEEYRALEERIIANFQHDLDHLDDLVDG